MPKIDPINSVESSCAAMEEFHKYLQTNYTGGSERFFSPTGFLESFQKTVEVDVKEARQHVFVSSVDEAQGVLRPVVDGGEGVYDLTAEPGTGKTSVLPFRFPSKVVVVALPTPFDAWSAYQVATGECRLLLKGLKLGPKTARVIYTDSYLAARALLSNYFNYDVMIVDECDSPRGVTRFLAQVTVPGKVLIRMSASHGRESTGPSRSFHVSEDETMPDIQSSVKEVAKFVIEHKLNRSLVLVPDADTAIELGSCLPGSVVVSTKSNLGDIAKVICDQVSAVTYVADDTCARSLNLNLDALFDTQLVAEFGAVRKLSKAELMQRKGRVGRNRPGFYYSPGFSTQLLKDNDCDIVRHNVVRAIGQVSQKGRPNLHLTSGEAASLMCSQSEPFGALVSLRAKDSALVRSSESSSGGDAASVRTKGSTKSNRSVSSDSASAPPWLCFFSSGASPGPRGVGSGPVYTTKRKDKGYFVSRRSSSSSSSDAVAPFGGSLAKSSLGLARKPHYRDSLPVADMAPYAHKSVVQRSAMPRYDIPVSPPVVDLTQLTYDFDWPALIRDQLHKGGDLPTLVPPDSWRHTSVGGIGNDWLKRLDAIAVAPDYDLDERELEVVCRAWNKLVAQVWVKRTPGLSSADHVDRVEFCVRYFQAYFQVHAANA